MDIPTSNELSLPSFPKPSHYLSEIEKLEQSLPFVLDDYKNQSIQYHKNPTNSENVQLWEKIQSTIESHNSQLFILTNGIEKGIEEINRIMLFLNRQIQNSKKKISKMKKRLGIVESEYNGSSEMIANYNEMYRMHYIKNVILFLAIFLSGFTLSRVFSTSPVLKK